MTSAIGALTSAATLAGAEAPLKQQKTGEASLSASSSCAFARLSLKDVCGNRRMAHSSRRGRSAVLTNATAKELYFNTDVSASNEFRFSKCECHDLYEELVPYVTAWKWQKETVDGMCAAVARGEEPSNSVILLQHPPVYTMGTRSSDSNLRFDKENAPFELHRTERGGEVTYHGPGQLVMYPILNLRRHKTDLHWYLRMLEEVVIRTLWSACGLQASRIDGLTGVWVGKFVAIVLFTKHLSVFRNQSGLDEFYSPSFLHEEP